MDYGLAILAARVSLVVALLAPGYYLLRTAFVRLQRRGLEPAAAQRLRQAVAYARVSHPYIAGILAVTAPYHVFVMWQTHPVGLKVALGMATTVAAAAMIVTGLRLKANPADMSLRELHRYGFFLMWAVLAAHRLA